MIICISPTAWASLSSPHPTPLGHHRGQAGLPMLYSKSHEVSVLHVVVYMCWCYFLHSSHSPSPAGSTIPSSVSVSPFLPCSSVQFSSVTQSCPTLCDPMDCSTPGLPAHHQLPEFTQTHVYWVSSSVTPFSSHLQSFPASGSFQMCQFLTSGGQSIGVLASASVLPMNIQDWSPLERTGWISLQSKGLSKVFFWCFKSISSLALSFLYSPTQTSIHDYWKKP